MRYAILCFVWFIVVPTYSIRAQGVGAAGSEPVANTSAPVRIKDLPLLQTAQVGPSGRLAMTGDPADQLEAVLNNLRTVMGNGLPIKLNFYLTHVDLLELLDNELA